MKAEFSKPQYIRLWDVFAVGPLLIFSGASATKLNPLARVALIGTGCMTIFFNGRNYLLQKKLEEEGKLEVLNLPTVQYTVEEEEED